jgi:hypothetical protein
VTDQAQLSRGTINLAISALRDMRRVVARMSPEAQAGYVTVEQIDEAMEDLTAAF